MSLCKKISLFASAKYIQSIPRYVAEERPQRWLKFSQAEIFRGLWYQVAPNAWRSRLQSLEWVTQRRHRQLLWAYAFAISVSSQVEFIICHLPSGWNRSSRSTGQKGKLKDEASHCEWYRWNSTDQGTCCASSPTIICCKSITVRWMELRTMISYGWCHNVRYSPRDCNLSYYCCISCPKRTTRSQDRLPAGPNASRSFQVWTTCCLKSIVGLEEAFMLSLKNFMY